MQLATWFKTNLKINWPGSSLNINSNARLRSIATSSIWNPLYFDWLLSVLLQIYGIFGSKGDCKKTHFSYSKQKSEDYLQSLASNWQYFKDLCLVFKVNSVIYLLPIYLLYLPNL